MHDGRPVAVSATNFLEMGLDVPALDAALICGWPGSLSSFFQQAGRVGRSGRPSLVLYVGLHDPVNAFLMAHPEYIFERPVEPGVVERGNPHVLAGQLRCAAQELPLREEEEDEFGPGATRRAARAGGPAQALPQGRRLVQRRLRAPHARAAPARLHGPERAAPRRDHRQGHRRGGLDGRALGRPSAGHLPPRGAAVPRARLRALGAARLRRAGAGGLLHQPARPLLRAQRGGLPARARAARRRRPSSARSPAAA